jgi:8-oxo-dGTP pyrophosphatase MutT (NUDIX family)
MVARRISLHGSERARQLLSGELTPSVPRDAATVILLREGPEVFLLRRAKGMAFAPGAYVFPGGSVDPADANPVEVGPAPELGVAPERARAILRAAVRETFEECGVQLSPELLKPWARWVTPEIESRRYDTFFFVALLPDGAEPDSGTGGESDDGGWFTPETALEAARMGTVPLMPPTAATLGELAAAGGLDAIWSQRRSLRPLRPQVTEDDGQLWLVLPEETP